MPEQWSEPGWDPAIDDLEDVDEPGDYAVVMLNDDYTTMEFVIKVLQEVFHHPPAAAMQLMLQVHNKGRAVVGTYVLDIARTKQQECMAMARSEGFPLKCVVERA